MSLFSQHLTKLSEAVIAEAKKRGLRLATAESCTAGLIAGCLTEIAGASAVLERGFITYSNESKMQLLGVKPATIDAHGAVSEETAKEMAEGVLKSSIADIAVSVTGIAGPGGGSPEKPVGLVYIAIANRRTGKTLTLKNLFGGDRSAVRLETVETALVALKEEIESLLPGT